MDCYTLLDFRWYGNAYDVLGFAYAEWIFHSF